MTVSVDFHWEISAPSTIKLHQVTHVPYLNAPKILLPIEIQYSFCAEPATITRQRNPMNLGNCFSFKPRWIRAELGKSASEIAKTFVRWCDWNRWWYTIHWYMMTIDKNDWYQRHYGTMIVLICSIVTWYCNYQIDNIMTPGTMSNEKWSNIVILWGPSLSMLFYY